MSSVSRILAAKRLSLSASARAYTTAASVAPNASTEGYYKVTQTRSLIGVPKSTIKGTRFTWQPSHAVPQKNRHGEQDGNKEEKKEA